MSFLNRCRGHSWCWAGHIEGCKGQLGWAGPSLSLPLSARWCSSPAPWGWGSGGRRRARWNCALGWQLTKPVRDRLVRTALVTAVFCIHKTSTALGVGSCDSAKAHYSLADSAQLVLNVKSTRFQQSCCERIVLRFCVWLCVLCWGCSVLLSQPDYKSCSCLFCLQWAPLSVWFWHFPGLPAGLHPCLLLHRGT